MDEGLVALRAALSGEPIVDEGVGWAATGNTLRPGALTQPGPPIWIGGNSKLAMENAVKHGQGWMPSAGLAGERAMVTRTASIASIDDLRLRLVYLRELMERVGREEALDICYVWSSMLAQGLSRARVREDIATLEAMGVTCIALRVSAGSNTELHDRIRHLGTVLLA